MPNDAKFVAADAYQDDVLALPVKDIDATAEWYGERFAMSEVTIRFEPVPTVILERNGVQIGFAVTGADPEQDGAAIRVSNIAAIKKELDTAGVQTANWRIDERDGKSSKCFSPWHRMDCASIFGSSAESVGLI